MNRRIISFPPEEISARDFKSFPTGTAHPSDAIVRGPSNVDDISELPLDTDKVEGIRLFPSHGHGHGPGHGESRGWLPQVVKVKQKS